jgi:hypothetical protein
VSYQIGEVVLMEHQGWLRAFRVVGAHQDDDEHITYNLVPLQLEHGPQWIKP